MSVAPFQATHNCSLGARPDPRELPLFDIAEAARFVGVSRTALDEWMRPVSNEAAISVPLFHLADPSTGRLSFANLAEVHILEATRKHQVPTSDLQTAITGLRARDPGMPYPLLTREFHRRGKRQFVDSLAMSIKGDADQQRRPMRLARLAADLDRHLERIERDVNDDPYQLFPVRHNQNRYVALNINLAAGQPVMAGTGLCVRHLSDLVRDGMSVTRVAHRYGLREKAVVGALAFFAA